MEMVDLATHAGSAVVGGLSVGGIVRFLVQRWVAKNDENHSKWGELIQKLEVAMTRISVWVEMYQREGELRKIQGETLAVLSSKVDKLEKDLNALGQKVRDLNPCCEESA